MNLELISSSALQCSNILDDEFKLFVKTNKELDKELEKV